MAKNGSGIAEQLKGVEGGNVATESQSAAKPAETQKTSEPVSNNTEATDEISLLKRQLKEAQERAERAESEAKEAKAVAERNFVRPSENVVVGNGYLFEVSIAKESDRLKFPEASRVKRVVCCDEPEAKRWFCMTTQHPDRPGRVLDPVQIPLNVRCLSEDKRREFRQLEARKAVVRAKAEKFVPLSDDEKEIYEKHILPEMIG